MANSHRSPRRKKTRKNARTAKISKNDEKFYTALLTLPALLITEALKYLSKIFKSK
jgi:hypothetical protein